MFYVILIAIYGIGDCYEHLCIILWFKKKFIHLIIILSIQFEIRVSYEVDLCPEWKKILDLVSIK